MRPRQAAQRATEVARPASAPIDPTPHQPARPAGPHLLAHVPKRPGRPSGPARGPDRLHHAGLRPGGRAGDHMRTRSAVPRGDGRPGRGIPWGPAGGGEGAAARPRARNSGEIRRICGRRAGCSLAPRIRRAPEDAGVKGPAAQRRVPRRLPCVWWGRWCARLGASLDDGAEDGARDADQEEAQPPPVHVPPPGTQVEHLPAARAGSRTGGPLRKAAGSSGARGRAGGLRAPGRR